MDSQDMFQVIFVKVDEFGWCHLDRIQTYDGTQFATRHFQEDFLYMDYYLNYKYYTTRN